MLFGILSTGALLGNSSARVTGRRKCPLIAHPVRAGGATAFSRTRALLGDLGGHTICCWEFSFIAHSVLGRTCCGLVISNCRRQSGASRSTEKAVAIRIFILELLGYGQFPPSVPDHAELHPDVSSGPKLVRSTGETYQCWWNALFKIFHSPPALRSVKKSVYR